MPWIKLKHIAHGEVTISLNLEDISYLDSAINFTPPIWKKYKWVGEDWEEEEELQKIHERKGWKRLITENSKMLY